MRTRVAVRRDAARAEVINAAWQMAESKGLAGINLRGLAARVGMRAPSLYSYFDSKNAIYDAMFEQGNRELLASMQGLLDSTETNVREILFVAAQRFLRFCNENPVRFQLLFQRSLIDWQPSSEAYEPAVQALEALRDSMTKLGIDREEELDMWTALLSGMANQQLANDPRGERWIGLAEDAVDMFLAWHERNN